MRATLFLILATIILGLFIWITLSGALFALGALLWLVGLVILVGYRDGFLLYQLGAREVGPGDEKSFFEAASQEAYKLQVPMPRLYFYNGSMDRAFVFQKNKAISLVLNKSLLEKIHPNELHAICFELLLQVKKGLAGKRTRSTFVLVSLSWFFHSLADVAMIFMPIKNVKRAVNWIVNFFIHPVLQFLFHAILGDNYFRKLEQALEGYPKERENLNRMGLKLLTPNFYYSLPSRKLMEFGSINRSIHYQYVMAMEFLPHEWDYLFRNVELKGAE